MGNKRLIITTLAGLLIALIVVSGAFAQTPEPSPTPLPASQERIDALLRNVEALTNAAGRTTDQASMVLGFIQAAAILGATFAAIGGILLSVTGLRTINEYKTELDKARIELKGMRDMLSQATGEADKTREEIKQVNDFEIQQLRRQAMEQIGLLRIDANKTSRALALLQLGEQQFETGNVKAAIQIYDEAHTLDPSNRATNYALGELYLIERNLSHAIDHLQQALSEDSDFAPAHAALGFARRVQGDQTKDDMAKRNEIYVDAEKMLLKALALDPSVRDFNKQSVWGTLGSLYRREGRLDDAIYAYLEAEKRTPLSSYPVNNLAQLYFLKGDQSKAHDYFSRSLAYSQRAVDANPYDYWAHFDLATARLALGETESGLMELEKTVAQGSMGPMETALAGLTNLRNSPHPPERIEEAIQIIEAAINSKQSQAVASPVT